MSSAATDRPITRRQLGAIITEFRRLGLAGAAWREYRLAITEVFTGRHDLTSTKDLTLGEAGVLVNRLRRSRDCRDLAAFLAVHVVEKSDGYDG